MTRVVFMGTPEFAVPSLQTLLSGGYNVVGVLTREDQPAGRGQRVEESPVKMVARANGLPVLQPSSLRDSAAQAELVALEPELIVVAAYGLILPQSVLDLPRYSCLNVHGSLLPKYRGAAPITAAILAGDSSAGITIMQVDAGLDTGPIISQASLPIGPADTTGTLTQKLSELGAELLIETIPGWLAGTRPARPQDDAEATLVPRINKDAGGIRWDDPAALIERRVRAYQPWPSAYTQWRGLRLKIIRARVESKKPAGPTGQVISNQQRAGVITGQGVLWLEEVQLSGKRVLPVEAFLRGAPGFIGSTLPS